MASKDQASVIRRSSRGRTGIDAKTKTDSGCFVDDDVEKQIDKSPPRNKSESNSKSEFFNANSLERNKKNTSNNLISGNSYNAVAHQREMSHSDELLNDEEALGDSKGNINADAKPNGDFYCLYYSDSPNSSLTRNKEKSANSSISDNNEDIGAKAEELLQKVKSEALRNKSTDDSSNKVNELPAKRKPPPVAPKPKRNSKNDSTSPKDPILDELEKLGASVGRDFSDVQENDSSVFSNAVKELQVAKTPEECFNRFDAIQSSLLENVPDTLERKKAKDEKEQTRRRSFPGADRNRKLSDGSNKDVNGNKSKENKQQESPKPLKQKSDVKKFSRTERESLQLMKEDSHHKRSHMNTDTSYTPKSLFVRPDSYRTTKTETTKKIIDKKESNKENIKKDKKPNQPTKGAKIGKKVDASSKGNGSTKTKERLKLRSSRRRINGDLTSIPEDGVIGVRIDDLDDNAIPLAKGEDDLSSGEDDLDKYDEDNSEDITDPSLEELDFPPPPSPSEMAVDSTCCSIETTVSKTTTHESRVNVIHENYISGSRNNSQRFENTKHSHEQLTSQQRFARAQSSSLSSDGWTSESTAGYSSANDADDEIERLPELETSEDFETYEDPEEIADMTFGTVIDGAGDDDTYIEEAPHRIPRSDIIVERRQQLQRKHVAIDREASSPTYSTYSHLPQESLQDDAHVNHYPIKSEEYQMDVDVPYHYEPEYYGNESEVIHHGKSNIIDSNIPRNNHITADTISFNNPGLEREDLEDYQVEQRPRKAQQENLPDPSGFMTVEDIKRLIFQGQKPSIPRSSSFCGASSHLKEKALQEQDEFQRQSWSGYSARQQQQQPVIDPLVREFPRRNAPLEVSKNSPYVRTVVQNPKRQHDFFSDSNLTTASEGMRNRVGRSQSFCGGTSLQHRTNSLENYQINVVRGDRGKRSRSFLDAPLQRRANSLDDRHLDIMSDSDGRVGPSRSIRGPPIQRRANSLDEYYSTNKMSSSSQRSGQPIQRSRLFRSPSDSSSDYSHSDNEQYHGQFSRTSTGSRGVRNSPATQYIDTKELFKLLSPQSMNEVVEQQIPPVNNLQHSSRNGRSTFPRKSSESLRIQAIRRASQANSDSDSDNYVETFKSLQNHPPVKQHKPEVKKVENRPTLSQRFSDVPQRINFDELAEQLNLPSDDEEDDVVDGRLGGSRSESEFGADLEFDYGDYFDDNNMIVGEALRLKKVLGCNTKQDPELETLVSEVTDPNIQKCKSSHVYVKQSTQTDEHLPLERPPSYSEVRKEMKAKRAIDNPNHFNLYDTDSSYLSESDNSEYNQHGRPTFHSYIQANTNRQRTDSGTQTLVLKPPTEKAISTDELLKMLINSSQGNLQKTKPTQNVQQNPQSVVQNLLFPAPQTKAASTGNIHSEKKFPGHVHQLYGSTDVSGEHSTLNRRRGHQHPPKYHKSHESLRRGKPSTASSDVLRAKLVSSSENIKDNQRRVFEEEVDCMRTKGMGDFSSGEISSGSSLDDVVETKTSPVASVAYIGCEETTAIETLPRVRQSSHRKRRKEVVGFLSDQDIPTVVRNDSNKNDKLVREVPTKTSNDLKLSKYMEPKNIDSENSEKIFLTKKDIPRIDLDKSNSATPIHDQENTCVVNGDQIIHFPHDEVPSPNSVNVFIDYKKNVMKVTTSTPKIQHGKLITDSPTSLSPVAGSPTERKKLSPRSSVGQEEFPPRYDSGSSSERSSSVYSSDDEKFFGSSDTVVFVDKTTESQSNKPNVDVASPNDQSACANNGHNDSITDDINAYSARVDSLLREVRSSLDLDSIGSDLLDQAMERVKDRLSPRSPDQAFGGLTMEAYVALNQADELQSIINEIKGELQILQEENSMLKETVVSLQLGDSQSASETTEASFTESAERIESIRKQIAAVVVNKQGEEKEEEDLITIDVLLRGFGETVGLKTHRKTDVKLGQVTVKGGADWTGVYDAAKTTFLDHIKRIAPSSCLGLGPTSMYGAQIGATMLTPETLRKKNPRVEISRKFNSCVIQLKDGMTDSFDTLIYDTLLPKRVIENYVHQVLEHRFVVLCGSLGMGKTHLATKLAEHIAQRFGSKSQNAVLTLSVGEKSRKELKKTLANLMKCDISKHSDGVPVVVILDQLDCLASLGDIFDPKQLEGNRNSPFIIGVRNKSKKGPFSAKELAIHKYFRWVQMSVYDRHVLGLLERFLRRKLSWSDNVEEEEDLMDLFIWLTQVWQRINQILLSYVDVEVTIGPSMFYTCPMDINTAEGWFVNVWNYTIIPYLHQNIRNSRKIYERDVPWEDPTKWVIMRWPWSRERSKVLPTLKKLRQVDIVLNRNNMESTKESKKESRSRLRKLRTNVLQSSPSKAGSLESWSTADWETASIGSEEESIASSTL